jgi:hypothetical protein
MFERTALPQGVLYRILKVTNCKLPVLFVNEVVTFTVPPRFTVEGETLSVMFSPLLTVNVVVAVLVLPAPSVAVSVIV